MYKKILAPLDGSEFSECGLEHVSTIAKGCKVPEVVLLRVIEPVIRETEPKLVLAGDVLRDAEARNKAMVESYLSKSADNLKKAGVAARTVAPSGNAAEEILDYAKKNNVDLIIMSTHGRSGVSRWVFGSVADKIVRHSEAPVLLVSPPGCREG